MEELFVPVVSTIVVALLAFFAFRRPRKRKDEKWPNTANSVAAAATESVQETFEDSVSRVARATDGEHPADDLADLGNARRRE